ncbi:MAG: hypothetical protein J1D88_04865 [Treponema sp.]|nr:hypothetical protein [Treponema sp.]
MRVPESVAIKTSARFQAAMGNARYDISGTLGASNILEKMQNSLGASATLYDYAPPSKGDTLSYLIRYPVYTIPIDVGEYLKNLNFDMALNSEDGMTSSSDFTIPSMNQDINQKIDLGDLDKALKDSMSFGSITWSNVPEPGGSTATSFNGNGLGNNTITVQNEAAESITFAQDSCYEITVSTNDKTFGDNYQFVLTATLHDNERNTTTSVSGDVTRGGTIYLGLTTVSDDVAISFGGKVSGGNSDNTHTYTISLALGSSSKIESVQKIKKSSKELGVGSFKIAQTVSLSETAGSFDSAVIGKGSVTLASKIPSGWSDVQCKAKNFKLTGFGANGKESANFITNDSAGSLLNATLDLTDKIIKSGVDLKIEGELEMEVKKASIEISNTPNVQGQCNIGMLKEVNIDFNTPKYSAITRSYRMGEGTGHEQELPETLVTYVRELKFEKEAGGKKYSGLGISCKVVNTLPAGNEVPIKISAFKQFAGNGGEYMNVNGKLPVTDEKGKVTSFTNYATIKFPEHQDGKKYYMDFTFDLFGDADMVTLKSLEPGKSYKFSITDVQFVYDWTQVKINLGVLGDGERISDTQDLSEFNIQKLLGYDKEDDSSSLFLTGEDLDKIKITELPVFFYAQEPSAANGSSVKNLLDGVRFAGKMYIKNGDEKPHHLLGRDDSDEDLSFIPPVPWPSDSGIQVSSSTAPNLVRCLNKDDKSRYSFYTDLADFVTTSSDTESDTALVYDIGISGGKETTLSRADVESLKSSSDEETSNVLSISIDMAAVLTFDITLTDAITMNIMEIFKDDWNEDKDDDLLNRKNASSLEDYIKYSDAIKYICINYELHNNLIPDAPVALSISAHGKTTEGSEVDIFNEKQLTFANGSNELLFTRDEIKKVMTSYPFHPDIYLTLGKKQTETSIRLSRNGISNASSSKVDSMAAAISIAVQMDGNHPITVWGGN